MTFVSKKSRDFVNVVDACKVVRSTSMKAKSGTTSRPWAAVVVFGDAMMMDCGFESIVVNLKQAEQ
jgi:hypothetical protein